MKSLLNLNFCSENGKIEKDGGAALFSVQACNKQPTTAVFTASLANELEDELVLCYSLIGLYRGVAYRAPFIYLRDENDAIVPLIANDDLNTDNRKYRLSAKIPQGKYVSLSIEISVDRAEHCELRVHSLYTSAKEELDVALSWFEEKEKDGISSVDITEYLNGKFEFDKDKIKIGGGKAFDKERICPHGITFSVKVSGNNCIAPDAPPIENEEIITNFGVKARRKVCRPISRDSKNEIKIKKTVSEVYFILGMTGERYQRFTFATKGNILGAYGKEVTEPLRVDDVEGFFVETVYKDGRRDKSLPKNISENRFSVSGDVSVYAVATDFSEVESVIFHNKKLDSDFSVLAISVNESEKRYYPELMLPKHSEKEPKTASKEKYIRLDGSALTIRNGALFLKFDTEKTLSLTMLKSDFAPSISSSSPALLRFKYEGCDDTLVPRTTSVTVGKDEAVITLENGAFTFLVGIDIKEENNLVTFVKVNNDSQKEEKIGIFYPCIDDIAAKSSEDLYYFVPKYQNVNSNESTVICEESSPSFPMQFMSIYSAEEQSGLGLLTRERDTVVRIYHLEKRGLHASLSIEYPDMYGSIGAGESFMCSETVISAAEGGFKRTFREYKDWLAGWYVPYKCQNKKWYRECFWLLAEITDFFETKEMVRFPIWHEKGENPKFKFLDILEEQKALSGTYPDILHMWHWTVRYDNEGRKHVKWGNWGGEDYDIYGGLDRFRAALDEFQKKTGVYSSIYMHPTLFAESYPDFKKYEHLKVVDKEGKNIQLADSFRMCHANSDWREYALDKYPRVYSELGVPILYVDEFSLRIENRCYAGCHGHEVPSNLLKTDREFITRLKDRVPEELVLYGEYAAVDINAPYIDCNITYGILDSIVDMIERSWRAADSNDNMSRVLTDAYRFAFPKIVQLVLPMALRNLSWHPHKFIFWNGEAEYDSFWDLLESDGNEFTCKAYSIKKEYADCFSSDCPEMLVKTLSPAICMNKFPGKNRTVYTVYNRGYRTYRGNVIRIPHTEGNVYLDAWNGKVLDATVEGGYATLWLEVDAQSIGCIAVLESENQKIQ